MTPLLGGWIGGNCFERERFDELDIPGAPVTQGIHSSATLGGHTSWIAARTFRG